MKRLIFLVLILIFLVNISIAQKVNQVIFDQKANKDILYGQCTREGFKIKPFKHWFDSTYKAYQVDKETMKKVNKTIFSSMKIKIIMATWCSDSRREIPRLFKILDKQKFDSKNNVFLILVDKNKETKDIDIKDLNINLVPTIIFYFDEKEVGRIIESPKESLEKDMLNIVRKVLEQG
jgi:thiol-disulfide isomerase/thioredoxin